MTAPSTAASTAISRIVKAIESVGRYGRRGAAAEAAGGDSIPPIRIADLSTESAASPSTLGSAVMRIGLALESSEVRLNLGFARSDIGRFPAHVLTPISAVRCGETRIDSIRNAREIPPPLAFPGTRRGIHSSNCFEQPVVLFRLRHSA